MYGMGIYEFIVMLLSTILLVCISKAAYNWVLHVCICVCIFGYMLIFIEFECYEYLGIYLAKVDKLMKH